MSFRLDTIRGDLSRGLAKNSSYQVFIGGNYEVSYRAIATTAPGRQLTATPTGVYGAPQEIGYGVIYQPITLTILSSAEHTEREFFLQWQDDIIGAHRRIGGASSVGSAPTENAFDTGYYNDYIQTVSIFQYDAQKDQVGTFGRARPRVTNEIRLMEAWPRNVGELSYSYQSTELLTFTVSIQYRYFTEMSLSKRASGSTHRAF
jgi:hypothetical protein|tara:strand:+ start:41 stop:652 length:612 start_codon:yes stop_codon:yes gene_type:complete